MSRFWRWLQGPAFTEPFRELLWYVFVVWAMIGLVWLIFQWTRVV